MNLRIWESSSAPAVYNSLVFFLLDTCNEDGSNEKQRMCRWSDQAQLVFFSLFFFLLLLLVLLHGGRIQPIHSEKRMYKLCVEVTCTVLNLRTHSTCLFCWSDLECDIFSDVLLLYFQPETKNAAPCTPTISYLLLPLESSAVVVEFMKKGFRLWD